MQPCHVESLFLGFLKEVLLYFKVFKKDYFIELDTINVNTMVFIEPELILIHSTVGKRAKRMPVSTVDTTRVLLEREQGGYINMSGCVLLKSDEIIT